MRIALISDIHGNSVSFDAVLRDIRREPIDQLICLGDVANLGPQPCEVMARLRAMDAQCVMGNHDEYLLQPESVRELPPWIDEVTAWCVEQLSTDDLDFLCSFHRLLEVPLGNGATLLCFHGSPRSNSEFIPATTEEAKLDEILSGHSATVMACGHVHAQMLRQHKGMIIVTVGSVGQPFRLPWILNSTPVILPWAEYVVVEWKSGALHVELRRVAVDVDAIRKRTLSSSMPGADYWVTLWCR
jgi:predicted phosphodiesterase